MIKFDLSQGDRGDFYITSKKIFTKDEAKKVIKELNMLQKLGISLFSENRTHVCIKVSDYKRLKRIREIGIELLDAGKKTRETNTPYHVIQKFHDFKFAIFGKEKRF